MSTTDCAAQDAPAGIRPLAADDLDAVNGAFCPPLLLGAVVLGVVVVAVIVHTARGRG